MLLFDINVALVSWQSNMLTGGFNPTEGTQVSKVYQNGLFERIDQGKMKLDRVETETHRFGSPNFDPYSHLYLPGPNPSASGSFPVSVATANGRGLDV